MMQTSTGAQDKEHLPQGKQSAMENDASHNNQHSALFYILQEVSKLPSPIHNSFLDTDPTSTWLKETSRQGPFIVKKQEADGHSFKITHSSFQHNLPHVAPHKQVKKIKEESQASKVTSLIEPHPECKSTWKVLSLINLHCQNLRHHSDVEESDSSSVSSATALDHSIDKSSTASVDVTDQGDGGDFMLVEYSYRPSVLSCEREEIPACGSPAKYMKACSGGACSFKTDFCVKNTKVGSCVDSRTVEKLGNVRAELVEENGRASSQPHYREQKEKEDKYSVNGQSEWNPECKKDNFFSEQDILNVPLPENALSQIAPNASRITFNPDVDAHLDLSKPALTLDHNANLALATEALCDTQLCPTSSASSLFSITEKCYPVTNQGHKITLSKQKCTHTPLEEKSPLIVQVESSSYNDEANSLPSATSEPEPRPVQKEEIAPPSSQQWRIKARRKQSHPSRSVDFQDPDIQGVTFRMDTELDDSREQCRLLITSKYSKELSKSARKPRMRTRTSQKSRKICSSDEESELTISVSKGKICASCCTRKTPMWRDAEDGTPLCNACGIRYKKYRVRCINCWHIPRKEGNSNSCCHKCGNFVKLTSALRKHTT